MKEQHENIEDCKKARPAQEYTHWQEFIDNLPYIIMTVLGALVFILGIYTLQYCRRLLDNHLCVSLLSLL